MNQRWYCWHPKTYWITQNVILTLKNHYNILNKKIFDWKVDIDAHFELSGDGSRLKHDSLWDEVTLTHTHTPLSLSALQQLCLRTAALLVLAESPTCCCCSARGWHPPALWRVSTARAGPRLGSPQDLIGCPDYSWGVGVSRKKITVDIYEHSSFLAVTKSFYVKQQIAFWL